MTKKRFVEVILICSVFLCPFIKGLYFYHASYIAGAILLGILLSFLIINKTLRIERSINHACILIGACLYFVSIFYAIDKGMAFMGFLKVLTVYIFYLVLMQLDHDKKEYIDAIAYSGIIMSFVGLLGFFIPKLGLEVLQKGRLGSFFQYPNTFSLFLLVCIIFLLARHKIKIYHLVGIIMIWAAIFLTFSRSMFVISVVTIVIYLIYDRKKTKYLIPSFTLGVLLGYVIMKASNLAYMFDRIEETSVHTSEWLTRLLYYKDSLSIIRDYPFGTGHLGYYYIQRIYQTGATYFVKYIHSNVLQVVMDIGIIGFLLMGIYFLTNVIGKKLKFHEKLALFVIFGHGAIDFDWEFPVVLFFVLLIVFVDKDKNREIKVVKVPSYFIIVLCIFMYLYMGASAYFAYIGEYEKSLKLYDYNTVAKEKLAKNYKETDVNKAYTLANDVVKQNKFALAGYIIKRDIDYEENNLEEAFISAERIIKLNPLSINHLEIYSQILLDMAKVSIKAGKKNKALTELEKILNIPYYIDRLAKERLTDYNVKHVPKLYMSKKLIQLNREAEDLLFILN